MGKALCVFKIKKINKEKYLDKKEFSLGIFQERIDMYCDVKGNPYPDTVFNRKKYNQESQKVYFRIKHYSDINPKPVRIFIDEFQEGKIYRNYKIKPNTVTEFTHGFQVADFFDVIIDFNENEIFIFAKKDIANHFMVRLKKTGAINYEKQYFNLKDIDQIPEIEDVTVVWEDIAEALIWKKALIGTQVHKSPEVDQDKVTCYNCKWKNKTEYIPDLFIAEDCRLSSRSEKVNDTTLFEKYYDIKKRIGIRS